MNNSDIQEQYFFPLPPFGEFDTMAALLDHCQKFSKTNGYAVSTKRSNLNRNITIKCDFGGEYRNNKKPVPEEKKRESSSRLINCPFELYGKIHQDDKWRFVVKCQYHNHAATSPLAHPVHRRLSTDQFEEVGRLLQSGSKPKSILINVMNQDIHSAVIPQTIYNAKQKMRTEILSGRTPMQALLQDLEESEWVMDHSLDEENRVEALFFAHPESIKLCRSYNSVILMDCTYKTNKYRLNLLDVVGITSFNTTFFVCFVFLPEETEPWYQWALTRVREMYVGIEAPRVIGIDRDLALKNALEFIFPTSNVILCTWHINMNIAKNLKKLFETNEEWTVFMMDWNLVMYANSERDFEMNWTAMKTKYGSDSQLVRYMQNTWMPYKENFIAYCINRHFHLGSHKTSRVEGSHSALKQYLDHSMGDLLLVKERINITIQKQIRGIRAQSAIEQTRCPHYINEDFFGSVSRKISHYALRRIKSEYDKAVNIHNKPLEVCHRFNATVMGLPCSHDIRRLLDRNENLQLEHVKSQWYLVRPMAIPMVPVRAFVHVREPRVVQGRGRPPGAINRATTRDPSGHEIAEGEISGRMCSTCGKKGTGHNKRTCPERNNGGEGGAPRD
jgi:hypothetical protein